MPTINREQILAVPVFNSESLRGGSFVRFFLERSATYPSRCSDRPVCPEAFLGRYRGSLPHFIVPTHKLSKQKLARLSQILNAQVAAFVLVWPACQYGLTVNYPNAQAVQPIVELVRWTCSSYIHNGEQYVASRLKLLAAWARYKAGPQLHAPPGKLLRFPFCDSDGVPDFRKLFVGSISDKATRPKTLFRFSRMSRAFPPGDKIIQEQALADHKALMTSSFTTQPQLLRAFKTVIKTVSKDCLSGVSEPGVSLSNSSSWERARKRGGAAEEITSSLLRHYPLVQYLTKLEGTSFEDYEAACRGVGFDESGIGMSTGPEGLPHEVSDILAMAHSACIRDEFPDQVERRLAKHNVIPVPDRGGFKVRVITAGQARVQCLAQNVRKIIYRNILPKTPSRWSLIEDGVLQFLRQLRKPTGPQADALGAWVVLSCDMKSATDRFPHDVVEAMNDSLESNLAPGDSRSANWVCWRMLSGPQQLRYPEMKEDDPLLLTTCGNLMGTAPSWVHLNLFNLTLIRTAWSLWASERWRRMLLPLVNKGQHCDITMLDKQALKDKISVILQHDRFNPFIFPKIWKFNEMTCIVGDDLGAVCPFGVACIYEIILEMCNGMTSFGKHYVQPWQDGAFMLLAEDWGIVKDDYLLVQPCESLRGIVAVTHQYDSRQAMPAWHQIGTTLTASVNRVRKSARRAVCSLGHTALHDWRSYLLRVGLPVYLPSSVGGLGWPHPRGVEYALDRLSIKTKLAYSALRGFRQEPKNFVFKVLELRSSWLSTERNSAYTCLLNTLKSYFFGFSVAKTPEGQLAPLDGDRYIVGLYPTRWAIMYQESRCRRLIDVIDKLVLHGLPVGYMCENISLTFDKPYREASLAAKRFTRKRDELLNLRKGHLLNVKSGSELAKDIQEDELLLSSLYIYIGDQFEQTFPHLSAVVLDSVSDD
ncbi:MAG: putative polyprotein [Bactrocera dorsalis narnavirus]|nr:MAG: putative polyprotein [Bactrocera dorsalis narnavirus]